MVYSVVLLHSSASSHRPSSRSARECVFLGGTTLAILSTNSHVYLLTAAQTYASSSPLISIIQHQTVINTSSSRIEMHSERNRSKQFAKTFRTMGYYGQTVDERSRNLLGKLHTSLFACKYIPLSGIHVGLLV